MTTLDKPSNSPVAQFVGPTFSTATAITAGANVLVVGVIAPAGELAGSQAVSITAGALPPDVVEEIEAALATLDATGKSGEFKKFPAPADLGVATVVAVGVGNTAQAANPEFVRRAAAVAARALDGVAVAFTTLSDLDITATVEGFHLGAYRFAAFRSGKSAPKKAVLGAVTLLTEGPDAAAAVQRGVAIATAVTTARDFVNTPPSHLYPEAFATRAAELGADAGLTVEVFDDQYLADNGYGGIVGVGKGSSRGPRMVRLSYTPTDATADTKAVALVGKGITFDTGGISIKPAAGMDQMTSDMAGAAAVIATVILSAALEVGVAVTATVPMAENMPSATAQRPGDVLTQYGGVTVEVLNTDAEGRLILADAMVRACEDNPDYLIDTATLTGAQLVALGTRTPGVMGTDDFRDRVAKISREVGENGWAMPFPEELRPDIDSKVADLANIGSSRFGGMLLAGVFLKEFVPASVQWAHVDVAGPAYNTGGAWGYTSKGGTGVPVRTMFAVIEDIAANG